MLGMGLKQSFDNEARDAWSKFCKFVCESIISNNYEEANENGLTEK